MCPDTEQIPPIVAWSVTLSVEVKMSSDTDNDDSHVVCPFIDTSEPKEAEPLNKLFSLTETEWPMPHVASIDKGPEKHPNPPT